MKRQAAELRELSMGISPCPNDTYIFEALINGRIPGSPAVKTHIADVEELNGMARQMSLDISKISLAVLPEIWNDYVLLDSGGALGRGCGPLLVAARACAVEELAQSCIATPGLFTTANLLLSLHGVCQGPRSEMVFDQIMPTLLSGQAEAGLLIHEGRFTYAQRGLHLVLDLGLWWEERFALPLPLGGIVVKRSLGRDTALRVQKAIRESLSYAHVHPEDGAPFVRAHAQEMDEAVMRAHIEMFVNEYSLDVGREGRKAIGVLAETAARLKGLSLPDFPLFL